MEKNSDFIGLFATVGTFDGVHKGHRFLLENLKALAARKGLIPAAMVLRTHPLRLVRPQDAPRELSTFNERCALIQSMGVKVIPLEFNETLRSETSAEFMARISDEMGIKGLLVGHDNRFGSDRGSSFEDYLKTGQALGLEMVEAPALPGISSSAVRRLLHAGNIASANELLGRHYEICGIVSHGAQLGRTIGFPTANLKPTQDHRLIPPPGVYATLACTDEKGPFRPSMTNIGHRPTVSAQDAPISIETHIFDINQDLYGRPVRLRFLTRIRDEQKFPSVECLTKQLCRDRDEIRNIISNNTYGNH